MLITSSGVAGRFAVTVGVAIPNVSLSGQLVVEINQTGAVVNETFVVGGQSQSLLLEAGSGPGGYVRVAGRGISLALFGQTLSGDFEFTSGSGRVDVSARNIELSLGDDSVLVVVNLDPFAVHDGVCVVPPELGLPGQYDVVDGLTGERYEWGGRNYVRLGPGKAHVFEVQRQ